MAADATVFHKICGIFKKDKAARISVRVHLQIV
jgi:hypothetical protein